MPNANDILWFKQEFHIEIESVVAHTPFTLDLLTAIACQETGYIWRVLRGEELTQAQLLELCVGDTLDENKGRRAFPRTKAALIAKPQGAQMFGIARQALVDMAHYIPDYRGAAGNLNKFCHGFGIFQYDLQFFLSDPNYFLEKRYADFAASLEKCIIELKRALRTLSWEDRTSLTDFEMACVGIAYNTGGFKPSKGLKQGYFNGSKYYGEELFDFIRLSKTVALPGGSPPVLSAPSAGSSLLPPPSPITGTGKLYEVEVRETPLNLRREPQIDPGNSRSNVIARLPDGQIVRALANKKVAGFLEVETSLLGAYLRGFAFAKYLKPVTGIDSVPVIVTTAEPPSDGIIAVEMPRRAGTLTTRADLAGAHSLNEARQPGRHGITPDELRSELAAIVKWLAVDDPSNRRYKPRPGVTFCNIYAHDYCHLAGVYLPRVWWTPGAVESLARGQKVQPLYGNTIDEQRANMLFRWLRDFGPRFGWRQTGTLDKLQLEVNQGAIGLIVARRKEEGKSGHIVVIVPETEAQRARRSSAGQVIAPLQSQAGAINFRYGTGKLNWWQGEQFADSAFWLHA